MTTIIGLHSSGSGGRQWARLAAALTPAHAMLAPDLIGYGEDAWSPGDGAVSIDAEAARIEAILDSTCGPVCLVGHSYGAAVAARVALHHHDRVTALALYEPVLFSLITRDAPANGEGREILAIGGSISDDVCSGRVSPAAARFVDYWSGEGAWAAMDARRREAMCSRMPKVAQEFGALFDDTVPLAAYARLAMPVLWLEGEATRTPTRAIARLLLPVLPDARYVRVGGAGHMGPITHSDIVNAEIVRFVESIDRCERLGLAA